MLDDTEYRWTTAVYPNFTSHLGRNNQNMRFPEASELGGPPATTDPRLRSPQIETEVMTGSLSGGSLTRGLTAVPLGPPQHKGIIFTIRLYVETTAANGDLARWLYLTHLNLPEAPLQCSPNGVHFFRGE